MKYIFAFLLFFETVASGALVQSTIYGQSMYPTIKGGGTLVYIDNYKFERLKEGDIVVYSNGEENVCHRLKELLEDGWKAKGDNNRFCDRGFVTRNNLIGKVKYFKNEK